MRFELSGTGRAVIIMMILPLIHAIASAQGWMPEKSETIWKGRLDGRDIVWSMGDISVSAGRKELFSLKAQTERRFTQEMWDWSGRGDGVATCDFAQRAALFSVTDRYLGIRFDDERNCASTPHPSLEARYATLDMRDSFRVVRLDELFAAEDIRDALLETTIVKKALAERGIAEFGGTLDELVAQLVKFTESCAYMFPRSLLSRFLIYDVAREKVIVRIGLPHGCESARGNLTDLTIELPVPTALAPSLRLAGTRKAGYLMRDGEPLSRNRVTSIRVRLAILPPPSGR